MLDRGFSPVTVTARRVVDEAPGVKSFYFDYDKKELAYRASQAIHLHLDPANGLGLYRTFSIGSSPTEDFLLLTTRMNEESEFKTKLWSLRPGDRPVVLGPVGNFSLEEDHPGRVVMIAKGIGITPFRSMIKYATDSGLPHKIDLIHINTSPAEAIFKRQLEQMATTNPNLKIVWKFIDRDGATAGQAVEGFLKENLVPVDSRFYIAGAPTDVVDLLGVVRRIGVKEIKMEVFHGYERGA